MCDSECCGQSWFPACISRTNKENDHKCIIYRIPLLSASMSARAVVKAAPPPLWLGHKCKLRVITCPHSSFIQTLLMSYAACLAGTKTGQVEVRGAGCSSCMVGHKCKLQITIHQPSHWVTLRRVPDPNTAPTHSLSLAAGNETAALTPVTEEGSKEKDVSNVEGGLRNDLSVLLAGPSMVHADVSCKDPPQCSRFSAVYRAWDVGIYRCAWMALTHLFCRCESLFRV